MTEWNISYYGNDYNNGLYNKQWNVEGCRSSCRRWNARYFDFNYAGNRGCYCKYSNSGRRWVWGVVGGEVGEAGCT